MSKKYYRLCKGLKSVGKLVDSETIIYANITDFEIDWYQSVFYYTEEHKKLAEEKIDRTDKEGKVYERDRGVIGIEDVKTNKIYFDFDKEGNVEQCRKEAIILIERLMREGVKEEDFDICFSGKKGFSVVLHTSHEFTPDEVRAITTHCASGLETFDTNIYNAARVFRIPLTKHNSGLFYKTPLVFDSLKTLNAVQIKDKARQKSSINPTKYATYFKPIELPENILKLKELEPIINISDQKKEDIVTSVDKIDFTKRPAFLTAAKYVLHEGHFKEGQRHSAMMILASTYKGQGFSRGDAYGLLKSVILKQSEIYKVEPFDLDEVWNNVLETVYSDTWNGGTYGANHPLLASIEENLPAYLRANYKKQDLVDNDYVFSKFEKFAVDIDKNTLKFGIDSLDNKVKLITGTSVGVLGIPSAGKSSIAIQLLSYNSLRSEESLFYSLDMNESLIGLMQMRRSCNLQMDQILSMVKNNPKEYFKIKDKAKQDFENVSFSFKYGITPAEIRQDIINHEHRTGKKVRLVVVDYLENVHSGYQDPTIGAGVVAQQLTNIAADLELVMVILLQTQKVVNPGEEIESMRNIKGASVIEQSLSVALGISRLGHQPKYKQYDVTMDINIIKNRFGPMGKQRVSWSGSRGSIAELAPDDKLQAEECEALKRADMEEEMQQRRQNFANKWG